MLVVVNHLTRMRHGYICVAGVDQQTGKHIRPLADGNRLRRPAVAQNGGAFELGAMVDLGRASPIGRPPEVEDHRFTARHARCIERLSADRFWTLLLHISQTNIQAIFGNALAQRGSSLTVDIGQGIASLGCLRPLQQPALVINAHNRIRLKLDDGAVAAWLPVTDLRLHGDDGTPRAELVQHVAKRISAGVAVILSVGLTRPFQHEGDTVERHYLQVNNIHLEDEPLWHTM